MQASLPLCRPGSREPNAKNLPVIFLLLLILAFLLKSTLSRSQQVAKVTPAGTKFLIYTPPGYSTSTTTLPLLVFLHGGGEIGDDLTMLTSGTSQQFPSRLIYLNKWPKHLPFLVLTPQLKRDLSIPKPGDQEWPPSLVNEVIEFVRKNYRVDAYRIYLTGISVGGTACWDYAATYPSKVAAVIPISAKSKISKACAIKNIPVWAFHGESDVLWSPKYSIDMINAIKACQPAGTFKPRLNLLYARMHEGWNELYNETNNYRIYDWLLKFRKNNTSNKTPYVNAGVDQKILLRSQPLHLHGDFFDWNGSISNVKWTQVKGVALSLSNTTSPFLKISSLKTGIFEFQLAVTDNHGAVSTDRVVVEIVSPLTAPAVTGMVLMNGKTNTDIRNLTEGQVINKTTLGITEINIRAIATSGTGSVRLSVNSDRHTRTVNSPGPYLIKKQSSAPEWAIKNGQYVICATPYPLSGGRGTPGISQCYKVSVTQSTTTTTVASAIQTELSIQERGDLLISNTAEGIQWVLNGDDIEGATSSMHHPMEPGEYFVRQTDNAEGKVSNSVLIDLSDKPDSFDAPEIYPNPAVDYLYVASRQEGEQNRNYKILNASGVTMQQGRLADDAKISLSNNLQAGDYFLILHDNHITKTVKFIIE